jgi:hypothetical protein
MKRLYFVLALIGAIGPYIFFIQYFAGEGVNPIGFIGAWFENGAVSGLSVDLMVSSLVFWIVMFQRQRAGKGPNPIPFILINLVIGLACAVPAYMYVREGTMERNRLTE